MSERGRDVRWLAEQLLLIAREEPIGVDISDFSDEWCEGFLAGQASVLEELLRDD